MAELLKHTHVPVACQGFALGWILFGPADGNHDDRDCHLIPDNDIYNHIFSEDCGCHPTDDTTADDYVWVHRAIDGREPYEIGEAQLN